MLLGEALNRWADASRRAQEKAYNKAQEMRMSENDEKPDDVCTCGKTRGEHPYHLTTACATFKQETYLSLDLRTMGGASIAGVSRDMANISDLLQVKTVTEFNGVRLVCWPGSAADKVLLDYQHEREAVPEEEEPAECLPDQLVFRLGEIFKQGQDLLDAGVLVADDHSDASVIAEMGQQLARELLKLSGLGRKGEPA